MQLLDSFLGSLPDSLCEHIYTYPGMIEALGRHATWQNNPDHVPEGQEQEVLNLATALLSDAPKKPRLPPQLEGWTSLAIATMNHRQLRAATEHYRDTGQRAFNALRRFSVSGV